MKIRQYFKKVIAKKSVAPFFPGHGVVRSYLCFFYLNKIIRPIAILDVSSLPFHKCETSMQVSFTLIWVIGVTHPANL